MNGYIKNKSHLWRHAMKRQIGPGQTVSLDDLYKQYGEKHGLEEGEPFVAWLKGIKLTDRSTWQVVYEEEGSETEPKKAEEEASKAEEEASKMVVPLVKKEVQVDEIANFSVREAREKLPKMTNLNLLKYAFKSANQLANKDTLCRMLRKRIGILELSKR